MTDHCPIPRQVRVSCPECGWSYQHDNPANLNLRTWWHTVGCVSLDELEVEVVGPDTDLVPIEGWNEAADDARERAIKD